MNNLPDIPASKNPALSNQIRDHLNDLTKPPGSLGRLEDLAHQYLLCKGSASAPLHKTELLVFAADHGITREGVSPYPAEVTFQMVQNMLAGGAAVTVLADECDMAYQVVDMGVAADFDDHPRLIKAKVDRGTASFLSGSAMSAQQCEQALSVGFRCAEDSTADLMCLGEMGIGNTSSASALYALLLEKDADATTGAGTGASGELLKKKTEVISASLERHRNNFSGSAIDALQRVGGFEIAAMTGCMIGCAARRIPVIIDGFIATAAALCATRINATAAEYFIYGHCSNEQYHQQALAELGAQPLLDLGMRLGEGSGAVLASSIVVQAVRCYHNMATFSGAGVSGKS